MTRQSETTLLANGSSAGWDVSVEEAVVRDEWSLEIDGPRAYLVFQLPSLSIVAGARQYLQAGPSGPESKVEFPLGQFGPAPVSLRWDNEDFPRCFLRIGPAGRAMALISLDEQDVAALVEALREVERDLS